MTGLGQFKSSHALISVVRPRFESLIIMPGAKICVVDDDMSLLCSLERLLASHNLDAEPFDDPTIFLDYVRAHAVRLAILDLCMPVESGIALQERLYHLS